MFNNYNDLIGTTFYYENRPYAIIENIVILINGNYGLELKRSDNIFKSIVLTPDEMELIYNDYLIRQERIMILKNNDVRRIVHFTRVDNLEKIFEYGILSVEQLALLSIPYLPSDSYRLDGKPAMISTSISYPNYKMFYRKRMEYPNDKWAVITISPKLIVDKLDTEFYTTNAASGIYSLENRPTSNRDLNNLFYKINRDPDIPKSYTTNPQAEVLVNNCIANSYFLSVETNESIPKVKSLTRDAHIDYNDRTQLFNARKDYKRW